MPSTAFCVPGTTGGGGLPRKIWIWMVVAIEVLLVEPTGRLLPLRGRRRTGKCYASTSNSSMIGYVNSIMKIMHWYPSNDLCSLSSVPCPLVQFDRENLERLSNVWVRIFGEQWSFGHYTADRSVLPNFDGGCLVDVRWGKWTMLLILLRRRIDPSIIYTTTTTTTTKTHFVFFFFQW